MRRLLGKEPAAVEGYLAFDCTRLDRRGLDVTQCVVVSVRGEVTTRIDGEVTTGIRGADMAWERWLAGLAVSVSEGEGTFGRSGGMADGDRGTVQSSLTSVSLTCVWR